jgi:glyoxylate reductase
VEESALIEALEQGKIAGAGLDVYEHAPEVPLRLRNLHNVVLLPHISSATWESRIEMGERVIINIRSFLDGHNPPDKVLLEEVS